MKNTNNKTNTNNLLYLIQLIVLFLLVVVTLCQKEDLTNKLNNYTKYGEVVGVMFTTECEKCQYDKAEGYVSYVTKDEDGRIGDIMCPQCNVIVEVIDDSSR
ncbi:MAG: hypothetical protein RSF67_05655 [Clostridia bacterium]